MGSETGGTATGHATGDYRIFDLGALELRDAPWGSEIRLGSDIRFLQRTFLRMCLRRGFGEILREIRSCYRASHFHEVGNGIFLGFIFQSVGNHYQR